jgi:hypothetical protein
MLENTQLSVDPLSISSGIIRLKNTSGTASKSNTNDNAIKIISVQSLHNPIPTQTMDASKPSNAERNLSTSSQSTRFDSTTNPMDTDTSINAEKSLLDVLLQNLSDSSASSQSTRFESTTKPTGTGTSSDVARNPLDASQSNLNDPSTSSQNIRWTYFK